MLSDGSDDSFKKILKEHYPECQLVWIQIRANILLVLIWVQSVCKGYEYQQMAKAARKEFSIKNGDIPNEKFVMGSHRKCLDDTLLNEYP